MTTQMETSPEVFTPKDYERAGHELQCARVPLRTTVHKGRRWFQCTECGYSFHEFTEGAANMVRRSGAAR